MYVKLLLQLTLGLKLSQSALMVKVMDLEQEE